MVIGDPLGNDTLGNGVAVGSIPGALCANSTLSVALVTGSTAWITYSEVWRVGIVESALGGCEKFVVSYGVIIVSTKSLDGLHSEIQKQFRSRRGFSKAARHRSTRTRHISQTDQ